MTQAQQHPTIKFDGFGNRELAIAAEILTAYSENKKSLLVDSQFGKISEISFNPNSGNVYAIDEDYNCILMNGDTLDLWLSSPYSGHEGFYADLLEMDKADWNEEDLDWFKEIREQVNPEK